MVDRSMEGFWAHHRAHTEKRERNKPKSLRDFEWRTCWTPEEGFHSRLLPKENQWHLDNMVACLSNRRTNSRIAKTFEEAWAMGYAMSRLWEEQPA